MLDTGFIKLYRSLLGWRWYGDINTRVVFIHLLLTVNYMDAQWRGDTIFRGQRAVSYAKLALEVGISIQSVRTALKHLILTGEVTYQSRSDYGLVTILNYDKFQGVTSESTCEQHVDNTLATCYQQQIKKARKQESKKEIQEDKSSCCTEPENPAPMPETIVSLPLNDGTQFGIFEAQVQKWNMLYPAVDVMQALRSMAGWLDANPTKRKTRRGIAKFVNSWLSKEQDRAGARQKQVGGNFAPKAGKDAMSASYDLDKLVKQIFEQQCTGENADAI